MIERIQAGTRVALAYGRGHREVTLPVDSDIIRPRHAPPVLDARPALVEALRRPLLGPPLRDLVPAGARVGISVCDVTRPFPSKVVLPVVLDEIPDAVVTVFIATGTHRPCTDAELDEMLGRAVRERVEVVQHDAFDPTTHAPVGLIPGTDTVASIDARFLDQDVRITLGFIEPHFFAGFSGGPKMVAPGLADIATILELHGARRIADPRAVFGVLDRNPVHEGIAAVAALVDVSFALDVALDADQRITGIFAGRPFAAHARGCEVVRATAMERVDEPYDVVLTTNSGHPLDQNLYQSVKGICAAAGIVRDGGAILIASACADGLPAHGRYGHLLRRWRTPASFMQAVASGEVRAHDQWQVHKQALVLDRARVLVHADGLTPAEIRAAWFEPAVNLESALRDIVGTDRPCRVAVLPEGPQTIAYVG